MSEETKIEQHQQEIDEDYELTREALREILETNRKALPKLYAVCESTEHPRAFEVLAKLARDTADIADKFLDAQRKKQVVDTESAMNMLAARDKDKPSLITYTATETKFTGSTEDMQKKIANRIKEEANAKS